MKEERPPLFTIPNHHPVEGCGTPPEIPMDNAYLSYFQNRHAEQWVFWVDKDTRQAFVTGGDMSWQVDDLDEVHRLDDESAVEGKSEFGRKALATMREALGGDSYRISDLLKSGKYARFTPYNEEEWAWLTACWKASEWARNPLPAESNENSTFSSWPALQGGQ